MHGLEVDEGGAVLEIAGGCTSRRQGEPALADASGADQRDEPGVGSEHPVYFVDVAIATDQVGERHRQAHGGDDAFGVSGNVGGERHLALFEAFREQRGEIGFDEPR